MGVSDAALDALIVAEQTLLDTLDGTDAVAILHATTDLALALRPLQQQGAVVVGADTRRRLQHALRLAEAARARVNILADLTQQRLSALRERQTRGNVATYAAHGSTPRMVLR